MSMNFSPNQTLAPGHTIGGKYKIVRELGRGGFGTVFEGVNEALKKKVAVKVLNANVISDATTRERFKIEMEAGAKLSHPNLISVIDSGFTESGEPYLVMEYVAGKSLEALLIERPRPQLTELIPILVQVGKALNYLHASNIIHRDLKPSNILVTEIAGETYAKLLDLGIAKIVSDGATAGSNLTATGTIFGTVAYMSPEQCQGQPIDARSDIYSFGCMLYECITGRMPFYGDNAMQVLLKHINDAPPAIPGRTDMERGAAEIALRCLQKNPRDRFQKIEQVTSALQALVAATPPTGQKLSRSYGAYSAPATEERKAVANSSLIIGGSIGIAVVLAAGLVAISMMQGQKKPQAVAAPLAFDPATAPVTKVVELPPPLKPATKKASDDEIAMREAALKAQLEAERNKNAEAQKKLAALAAAKEAASQAKAPGSTALAPKPTAAKPSSGPELVYNGNFEQGPGGGGWTACPTRDSRIAGWMVTSGAVDYFNTDRAVSGHYAVDLNAQDKGTISQVVRTTPGKKYELKFCIGEHPFGGGPKSWYATAGKSRQAWALDFHGQPGWRTVTMPFTASGAQTTISIGSMTAGGSGPMLDDVSVTKK